mmetsp:Transcript_12601/g.34711  ORF Transcript_12601/g.34711 Transcript_12601/m.34711 type:complete len:237 (-) Transcript_12601:167-877(-)
MAAESSEHFDEWATGSMRDLAQRMDDIDKQLEEIVDSTNDETGSGDGDKNGGAPAGGDDPQHSDGEEETALNTSTMSRKHATDTSTVGDFDDYDDDDDDPTEHDYDMALGDLQSELNEVNAAAVRSAVPPKADDFQTVQTLVTVSVKKPSKEATVGISMKTVKGVTRITAIRHNGLLKDTDLKRGYEILQVNNVPVKNARHARFLIQETPSVVTIKTRIRLDPMPTPKPVDLTRTK